jgi:hypothetical protein
VTALSMGHIYNLVVPKILPKNCNINQITARILRFLLLQCIARKKIAEFLFQRDKQRRR